MRRGTLRTNLIFIIYPRPKKIILKFQLSTLFYKVYNENNSSLLNEDSDPNLNENQNFYENNEHKNNNDKKHKVLVDDPFNNRNIILNVTKSQKGIYI